MARLAVPSGRTQRCCGGLARKALQRLWVTGYSPGAPPPARGLFSRHPTTGFPRQAFLLSFRPQWVLISTFLAKGAKTTLNELAEVPARWLAGYPQSRRRLSQHRGGRLPSSPSELGGQLPGSGGGNPWFPDESGMGGAARWEREEGGGCWVRVPDGAPFPT